MHLSEKPLENIVDLEKIINPNYMFIHDYEVNLWDYHGLKIEILFNDPNNYRDSHWIEKNSFSNFFKEKFLKRPSTMQIN